MTLGFNDLKMSEINVKKTNCFNLGSVAPVNKLTKMPTIKQVKTAMVENQMEATS